MFRKKKADVRILDTPIKLIIDPKFVLAPLPNGQVVFIYGNFEFITDSDATLLAERTINKIVA